MSSRPSSPHFCLKDGNNFSHCLALGGITFPTPLDHPPHMIREFRTARPGWSASHRHRMHPCGNGTVGKRSSSSEYLNTDPIPFSILSKEVVSSILTSQTTKPNAYTSSAIVAPVSAHRRKSISSGAVLQDDRSMPAVGTADRMEADPKPAMRTWPSPSTRMLV